MSTPYHSAFFAYELTKRSSSDDIAKLGPSLFNATVDLNPHQLDAALFAFRSPLSRGAILADEVGLGKTIEAGLIISQLWAEHKRRILIIVPTMLRKQWAQELTDKFFIPPFVMDSREYNSRTKSGEPRPLEVPGRVVICSYNFAWAKQAEMAAMPWDLVVIDEAHRLRNVYKTGNRIANSIKASVGTRPLVLLTATPLQNSLLELYGLVSFLDEHVFGDIEAFRARYMRGSLERRQLAELQHRLRPFCQRTLRRQVQEYVRFTNRIPITQDFTPTIEEQRLYDQVSEYLQRDRLNALPTGQRTLMTMVLRKLLASSTFAIADTLETLSKRLDARIADIPALAEDFETFDETAEEWSDGQQVGTEPPPPTLIEILAEVTELAGYSSLATSITVNAKGQALLLALEAGFKKLGELGANEKAVIFTESRRTQAYLLELLNGNGYSGRVLTINGTNTDDRAGTIYKEWAARHRGKEIVTGNKTVDLRAALVEQFRDHASILIATEAAAEGVNLQFCSLVVNYDLPWNPQRIEQRIGRCHRYGQQHDVVVINLINRANAADRRVFDLLSEKFQLFDGVFGASDEVLGALESGVDFERRIADIYQSCRTTNDIDLAFEQLRFDLDEQITVRLTDTRTKLLENFDEDVHRRLRISREQSQRFLDRIEKAFWNLTKYELREVADFDDEKCQFTLRQMSEGWPDAPLGEYQIITPAHKPSHLHAYRLSDNLAQATIQRATSRSLPPAHVVFDHSNYAGKIGILEPLVGQSGWLALTHMTISSLEAEDALLVAILNDSGESLNPEIGEHLFKLTGRVQSECEVPATMDERLSERTAELQNQALAAISNRNSRFFDEEIEKLERWADDLKHGLEMELKDLETAIKQARKDAKLAPDLQGKLNLHRTVKELESTRSKKRRELYEAQDEIDARKEELISGVESRLQQSVELRSILRIRWSVA